MQNKQSKDQKQPAKYAWPVFDMSPGEREPWRTDEQWASVVSGVERHARAMGVYLGFFQMLCTHRGHHRKCQLAGCRRLKRCTGRRAEDDTSGPFAPFVPPCVPLEAAIVEEMREEIRAEVRRIRANSRPEQV
jgi:hypothetical protein